MIVTFWKGVFVVDTLDERGVLKKAGFELHEPTICNLERDRCKACRSGVGRRYWSDKLEAATRLRNYCNPRALSVLKEHLDRLEKSRAVDADIDVPSPPGFAYKGYQRGGIAYMVQRKDSLNADDMGLGKTIQALGFINYVKPRRVLVVCTKTLILNWEDEARRWLVDASARIYMPRSRSDADFGTHDGLEIVITSYERIARSPDKPPSPLLARILEVEWDVAVYDECQAIKNLQSNRSNTILGQGGVYYRARRNLFLTGTPVENRPAEIWPIAATVCPAKFGDWWKFAARYCGLHQEERRGRREWVASGATHLAELQQKLRANFMVRRLKGQVLPELPKKLRQLVVLPGESVKWQDHPSLADWKKNHSAKYDRAMAAVEEARSEDEYRRAAKLLDEVAGVAFEAMSKVRHESALAKLPACLEYLDEVMRTNDESVIVFAHHTDVVEKTLETFEKDSVGIYGKTSQRARQEAVRLFQDKKKRLFVGQIRTAGSGITLTAGSLVVFFEIDWVPGVVTQCEDRACRIGQEKMVHVQHLIQRDTLDANMVRMIVAKQDVISKTLDTMPQLRLRATGS